MLTGPVQPRSAVPQTQTIIIIKSSQQNVDDYCIINMFFFSDLFKDFCGSYMSFFLLFIYMGITSLLL